MTNEWDQRNLNNLNISINKTTNKFFNIEFKLNDYIREKLFYNTDIAPNSSVHGFLNKIKREGFERNTIGLYRRILNVLEYNEKLTMSGTFSMKLVESGVVLKPVADIIYSYNDNTITIVTKPKCTMNLDEVISQHVGQLLAEYNSNKNEDGKNKRYVHGMILTADIVYFTRMLVTDTISNHITMEGIHNRNVRPSSTTVCDIYIPLYNPIPSVAGATFENIYNRRMIIDNLVQYKNYLLSEFEIL